MIVPKGHGRGKKERKKRQRKCFKNVTFNNQTPQHGKKKCISEKIAQIKAFKRAGKFQPASLQVIRRPETSGVGKNPKTKLAGKVTGASGNQKT